MTARWAMRLAITGVVVGITACAASAGPERSPRPNEVQVVEPAGKPDLWTYAPSVLSIAKGTTVTFVNHGKEFHTVTSDDPGRPFDISIDTNQTKTFTFEIAGTFRYHCGIHPQMTGTIRVCDGACG